jgi:hypothetical protein
MTSAGRSLLPVKSVNGKRVRTTLPKSNIRALDIRLAVKVRLVGKKVESGALLRHSGERHIIVEGFDHDPKSLTWRDAAALDLAGQLFGLDIFQYIAHWRMLLRRSGGDNHTIERRQIRSG